MQIEVNFQLNPFMKYVGRCCDVVDDDDRDKVCVDLVQ